MRNKKFLAFMLSVVMIVSAFTTNTFAATTGNFKLFDYFDFGAIGRTSTKDFSENDAVYEVPFRDLFFHDFKDTTTSLSSMSFELYDSKGTVRDQNEVENPGIFDIGYLQLGINVFNYTISSSAVVSSASIEVRGILSAFDRSGDFMVNGSPVKATATSEPRTYNITYTVPTGTKSVDFAQLLPYGLCSYKLENIIYYEDESYQSDNHDHTILYFAVKGNDNYSSARTITSTLTYEDKYKTGNDYVYNITIIRPAFVNVPGGDSDSNNYTGTSSVTNTSYNTNTSYDDLVASKIKAAGDITLTLPANETSLTLSHDTIAALISAGKTLYVVKNNVTLALSPAAMEQAGLENGKKVQISMVPYTQKEIESFAKMDAINKTLFKNFMKITVRLDGKEVKNFPMPLFIRYNISKFNLTPAQIAKLTGVRILDDGKVNQLGGNIIKTNVFEFSTNLLSNYGILVSDNLVKISTTIGKYSYMLNGKSNALDVAPVIIDGRTMVPVRFIAESLGAEVSWNDNSRTANISLGGKNLSLVIDHKLVGMDVAPVIVDNRTLVPLRYISENLDANVTWYDSTKTVEIAR